MQVKPQLVPLQVAVALAGGTHGVQLVPQVLTLPFDTQAPLHWCAPDTHAKPQLVPSQVELALAGGLHAMQLAPQVAVSVFDTHTAPQR